MSNSEIIKDLEKIKNLVSSAPDICRDAIDLLILAIKESEPPNTTTEEKPKYG